MRTANFTDAFIRAIKPPRSGRVEYWDGRLSSFGLRVTQTGARSWCVFYRYGGRLRRLTLGSYPRLGLADARAKARKALRDAALGLDPAGEKRAAREADVFGALVDRYVAEHANAYNKPRTISEKRKLLEAEILPKWKNFRIADIKRRDVIALVDSIAARGARIHSNRVLALINSIFNFAISKEIIEANPAHRVPKPGREQTRDRVLSEAEVRALWLALNDEPLQVAALFKLGLLVAQRRGEILGAEWREFDLDSGWWTIPGARTKNRLAHRVPLAPQALAIVRDLRAQATKDATYVFPGPRGKPISEPKKWVTRVRARAAVLLREQNAGRQSDQGLPPPLDFWLHDLRRTAATNMAAAGVDRLVVGKVLNHVEHGVTAIYERHSYDAEKRAALSRWDRRLGEIVSGEPTPKVVALR
jgi:integrase